MTWREFTLGRWPEIISKVLGPEFADKKKHAPCPCVPGSKDCYRFSDKNGMGNFFCRCSEGQQNGFDLLQCRLGTDFDGACRAVEEAIGKRPGAGEAPTVRSISYAEELRALAVVSETSLYLESRGLSVPPGIRWARRVKYWQDDDVIGFWPAMLAPITAPSGGFAGMHVTYLEDGKKAPLTPDRKIFKRHSEESLAGAACRLVPPAAEMGVAEGIETALAASKLFGMPVWAALNTSLLETFIPPENCEILHIFGDNDKSFAGHKAAYVLAKRLYGKGVQLNVHIPKATGDWNDVLLGRHIA